MTTAAPDWSTTAQDIHCPLCDYNLRGLSDPRCPECGFTFDWRDLLDPQLRQHPYLFEHHPRHNVWSFAATLTRKFHPNQFWKRLSPSQPVKGWRLGIYWLVCAFVAAAPAIVLILLEVHHSIFWLGGPIARPPSTWRLQNVRRSVMTTRQRQFGFGEMVVHMSVLFALWPLIDALVLLIFQQSMRRVNIKPSHAVRCAIYSGDIIFWNGVWQLTLIWIWNVRLYTWGRDYTLLLITAGAVVVMAVNAVRLFSAYRDYLKFRDPFATVVASQAILLLLFCVVMTPTLIYFMFLRMW